MNQSLGHGYKTEIDCTQDYVEASSALGSNTDKKRFPQEVKVNTTFESNSDNVSFNKLTTTSARSEIVCKHVIQNEIAAVQRHL